MEHRQPFVHQLSAPEEKIALFRSLFRDREAQAMRLSTCDKPRVIACAEDHPHHIGVRRGWLEDVRQVLRDLKIQPDVRDER